MWYWNQNLRRVEAYHSSTAPHMWEAWSSRKWALALQSFASWSYRSWWWPWSLQWAVKSQSKTCCVFNTVKWPQPNANIEKRLNKWPKSSLKAFTTTIANPNSIPTMASITLLKNRMRKGAHGWNWYKKIKKKTGN